MASSQQTALNTNPPDVRIIQTNELVTGPPAAEMLQRSEMHKSAHSQALEIMDNCCGGGILTTEALKLAEEQPNDLQIKRIVASDIDDKMVSYVSKRSEESGWKNVEAMRFDQQAVPLPDETFTHVFSNFGIFFCPNDEAVLAETFRILNPGGAAGFTSWKTIAWWPSLAMPAISAFLPEAPGLPAPATVFPARSWGDPAAIPEKLEKAGFKEIEVGEYAFTPDVPPAEFAEACAVLIKVITKRLWSEEENKQFGDRIEPALLKYLHENFPNGKWNGMMVATISMGRKS